MCPSTEIDYTYLISEIQDAQGELEQHDARLTRLERALGEMLSELPSNPYLAAEMARHELATDLSAFITT